MSTWTSSTHPNMPRNVHPAQAGQEVWLMPSDGGPPIAGLSPDAARFLAERLVQIADQIEGRLR